MSATFTRHGFSRVLKRLKLEPVHVARLLDNDFCVDIGKRDGANTLYRLFYSSRDKNFFVAVQNKRTGEIVTILPLDYHQKMGCNVTYEALQLARELAGVSAENSRTEREISVHEPFNMIRLKTASLKQKIDNETVRSKEKLEPVYYSNNDDSTNRTSEYINTINNSPVHGYQVNYDLSDEELIP